MRPEPVLYPPRPFQMDTSVPMVSSPPGIPAGTLKFPSMERYLGEPAKTDPTQAGDVVFVTVCENGLGRLASSIRPGCTAAASQREYAAGLCSGSGRRP